MPHVDARSREMETTTNVTRPRTILLTGATGVVGSALLSRLHQHRVICLVHRNTPDGGEHLPGDLSRPDLGLLPAVRQQLAEEVDVVVHCAAVTDFSADAVAVERTNVAGTRAMVGFAAEAGATLHYVSTAFVARADKALDDTGDAAADPSPYLRSKREAEELVRQAPIHATIIRPSVVIGDSRTGEMAKFQGLHTLAAAVLRGVLPLVPLRADDRIDMIPQDRLAEAIVGLIEADVCGGEFWVTAGANALTAQATVDLTVETGRRLGGSIEPPRLVNPDMVDRLVRPVFVEPLPPSTRRRFDDLVVMSALCATKRPFPSNIHDIPGCSPVTSPEIETAYRRSVEYLARSKGAGQSRRAA